MHSIICIEFCQFDDYFNLRITRARTHTRKISLKSNLSLFQGKKKKLKEINVQEEK